MEQFGALAEGRTVDREREAGVGGIPASSLTRTALPLRTRRAVRPGVPVSALHGLSIGWAAREHDWPNG